MYFRAICFKAQCDSVNLLFHVIMRSFFTIASGATQNGSSVLANAFHSRFVFELSLQQ